jgi:CBS domain-containing protein
MASGMWAGVSRSELMRLNTRDDAAHRRLADLLKPIARPYLYPDQSIEFALRVLHDRRFVPVVHRADTTRLVGLIALEDIIGVYRGGEWTENTADPTMRVPVEDRRRVEAPPG